MIRLSEEQGSWLEGVLRNMEGAEPRTLADQILDQLRNRNTGGQVIDRVYQLISMDRGRNHITRDVVDALRKAILAPSELRAFDASMKDKFACIQCGRPIMPGEAVTYMPTIKDRGVACVHCSPPSTVGCQKCGVARDIGQSFRRLIGRVKLTCTCKDKSLSDILKEKQEQEAARPQDPFGRTPARMFSDPETGESFVVGSGRVAEPGNPQRGQPQPLATPPPTPRRDSPFASPTGRNGMPTAPWDNIRTATRAERERMAEQENARQQATWLEQQRAADQMRQIRELAQMEEAARANNNAAQRFRGLTAADFFAPDSVPAATQAGGATSTEATQAGQTAGGFGVASATPTLDALRQQLGAIGRDFINTSSADSGGS